MQANSLLHKTITIMIKTQINYTLCIFIHVLNIFLFFLSIFRCHAVLICYMSSQVISHTDILLYSDIFLDSLVISTRVLSFVIVSVIVMLAFEFKFIHSFSSKTLQQT